MKIYSIVSVIFCVILLISCNSSENWMENHSRELSKVYRDETLIMTFNGEEMQQTELIDLLNTYIK